MRNRIKNLWILLLAALPMAACHDDEVMEINFNATMEQPTAADGSKVYLENEQYIFWELNDRITIASDKGIYDPGNKSSANPATDDYYSARLVNANALASPSDSADFGFFNGVFISTMQWGSQYFLGIHPRMNRTVMPNAYCTPSSGSSDFGTVNIYLPREQGLRTDERGDFTFNKQVWPMVAWYGGSWTDTTTAFNLDFHSLGTIVRLHLYNSTGSEFTLDSIVFVSENNATQLSGIFEVQNYKTEDPNLKTCTGTGTYSSVALKPLGINFSATTLRTFYLVLPAYKGRHQSTSFNLTMNVYATQSGSQKVFTKNFSVTTRRNGITNMRAIAIDSWASPTLPSGLAGCGTQERPFKVYNYTDLTYLRRCYENGIRKINQQAVSENTWIRIMRSDIVLGPDWATSGGGINDFVGHMTYATTGTNTTQAIVNNSLAPLFKSINAQGHVEGITINCDTSLSVNTGSYTPFCTLNRGEIKNCRVMSNISTGTHPHAINVNTPAGSGTATIAGICLDNQGTITGSGCIARFDAERCNVAGICYTNQNIIRGCYVAAPTTVLRADNVAGICYTNTTDGSVKDSYYATSITGVTYNCGGIVFDNKGVVEHCYLGDAAAISTTGSVGGIVNTNNSDPANCKVDYCYVDGSLTGSTVGLIAATVTNGRILNCFCNNNLTIVTLRANDNIHYGGGLVGVMSGGSIENSYVYDNKIRRINNNGIIGGLVGRVSGTSARIINCYCYETEGGSQIFYGSLNSVDEDNLFNNCYLVNQEQTYTGIESITPANAALDASTSTGLTYKLNNYNTPSFPSDYKAWVLSGSVPALAPYATPSSKRNRR